MDGQMLENLSIGLYRGLDERQRFYYGPLELIKCTEMWLVFPCAMRAD